MAEQQQRQQQQRREQTQPSPPDCDRPEGGPGASDSSSGGGNATGIPDAETAMRTGDVTNRGNPDQDREKLFGEAEGKPPREDKD